MVHGIAIPVNGSGARFPCLQIRTIIKSQACREGSEIDSSSRTDEEALSSSSTKVGINAIPGSSLHKRTRGGVNNIILYISERRTVLHPIQHFKTPSKTDSKENTVP